MAASPVLAPAPRRPVHHPPPACLSCCAHLPHRLCACALHRSLDKPDNLFFLSGKLEALDSPGEWWVDTANKTITVWMPDSGHPADRVRLKTKDLCIEIDAGERGAPVHLVNLSLVGCTFKLLNCNNCTM